MTEVGLDLGIHPKAPKMDAAWKSRWPNISPKELACKGTGEFYFDPRFNDALQAFRNYLGKPITITSGHRSVKHNRAVGGVSNSQHLKIAADIGIGSFSRADLLRAAVLSGFRGLGLGGSFLHIDQRPNPVMWIYQQRGGSTLREWANELGFDPIEAYNKGGVLELRRKLGI
jgi:zinc D-Ala-D-Ala carboxypeptidase